MRKYTISQFMALFAAMALAAGLGACADVPPALRTPSNPIAIAPAAPAVNPQAAATIATLAFRSFEMGFEPASLTVDQPGRYAVRLVNDGALPHDITFPDGTRIIANPGDTAEGEVVIPAEGLRFICGIAGHEAAGMVGQISVAGQLAPAAGHDDHGGPMPAADVQPDPSAPAPVVYDPAAPALMSGTTHEIILETIEKEMVVAPGFVQKVWTFGGTVPGPVIRVKVGDTVRIRLKNPASSEVPHSVDFHSSLVAWNDEMTSIMPGEEKIYEWKAEFAGVWMYHCGTAPALHHIANGMYGMVIVEPQGGLPPVDNEFVLVQSEWYLGL